MKSIIAWLEQHQLSCFYKKTLGIECPGCGLQTSFIELLKGNIAESISIYPPLIPTIIMLFILILHLKFKFRKGPFVLKSLFILVSSIVVLNYIINLLTH